MTLTFPRHIPRFLAALATALAAACYLHFAFSFHGMKWAYYLSNLVLAGGVILIALWRALRRARYLLRPETLQLNSRVLTIRHRDAEAWQTLQLPLARLLDVWTDGDTLHLVWQDRRLRHVALNLQHARYRDTSGKTRPGSADAIAQRLRGHLPPATAWPPARVPDGIERRWTFSRAPDASLEDYTALLVPFGTPVVAVIAWSALRLDQLLQQLGVPATILVTTVLILLAFCAAFLAISNYWLRQPQRPPLPDLILARDGIHHGTTHIPWAGIRTVEEDRWHSSDDKPRRALHLYWQPHANARYLRHNRIDTSYPANSDDCDTITRQIAAHIRLHSPNLGTRRDLPAVRL